jgi:uncharacterized protein (DUF2164 family)
MNAHTDVSKVKISKETVKLKAEIEDYLKMATAVSIKRIVEFHDKIQAIHDDASRIVLETWYYNQPLVSAATVEYKYFGA